MTRPHNLPGFANLISTALKAPCHLGEGNDNREVEKVEVEGKRGLEKRKMGEEKDGGRK